MRIPDDIVEEYPYTWRDSYAYNQFYTLGNTMCPRFEGEKIGDAGVLGSTLILAVWLILKQKRKKSPERA